MLFTCLASGAPTWSTRKKIHRDFLSGVPLRVLYYLSTEGQQWVDFLQQQSHPLLSGTSAWVYSDPTARENAAPHAGGRRLTWRPFLSVRSRVSWKTKHSFPAT